MAHSKMQHLGIQARETLQLRRVTVLQMRECGFAPFIPAARLAEERAESWTEDQCVQQ